MQSKFSIAEGIVNNRIRSRLINVQIKKTNFTSKEKRERNRNTEIEEVRKPVKESEAIR